MGLMRGFNGIVLLLIIILAEAVIDVTSLGILKAFLSPPMPRINRIKNISPRAIREMDPFAVADFLGLVRQYNYPAEEYNVTTIDGYNLILHRIPNSPNSFTGKKRPVVLLQHGLIASSDSWVLFGPGKDLAFLLADAGYDVWLGNFRGNTYSRSHIDLDPEKPSFWQFSFHEMGFYDLPAMIDYILEITGQKNLIYIGHSMGTTCSYIMLSMRPEYNKRLRLVISLAPVAYWKHKLIMFEKLAVDNGEFIEETFRSRGIHELVPQSSLNSRLTAAFCSDKSATQKVCANVIFAVVGFDSAQFNVSLIPYLAKYLPAGGSTKTFSHFYQNMLTGNFRQFNYGYVENFGRYQQKDPPEYNVSRITAPVALFYGLGDALSKEEDAKELKKKLPNIIKSVAISYKFFNHLDFLWANDGKRLLYDEIIELIRRYK